jgi:hypothetical protein
MNWWFFPSMSMSDNVNHHPQVSETANFRQCFNNKQRCQTKCYCATCACAVLRSCRMHCSSLLGLKTRCGRITRRSHCQSRQSILHFKPSGRSEKVGAQNFENWSSETVRPYTIIIVGVVHFMQDVALDSTCRTSRQQVACALP